MNLNKKTAAVSFFEWIVISMFILHLRTYSQSVIYPLHSGDIWEYKINVNTIIYESTVADQVLMPDSVRYAKLYNAPHAYYEYQHQDGSIVRRYNQSSSSSSVLYDFNLSAGDTVGSYPVGADTLDIILVEKKNTYLFGSSRRQWLFHFNHRQIVDADEGCLITDSLGLTALYRYDAYFELTGAIINGVKYGNVMGVNNIILGEPQQIRLYQNYPNPFNPTTTIEFTIPTRQEVFLKVFNVLGQMIATLVDGTKEPGTYKVNLDASDFSSGKYFFQLQAGMNITTRSFTVIK
jgi:hypothetical protein